MRYSIGAPGLLLAASLAAGDGSTDLLWAAYHDDLDRARKQIRQGADVNAANDLGATPLWAAAQNGSAAMTAELLRAGADPNKALLAGETPLMVASRGGFAAVVGQLLASGADPDRRATRGQTALMWAAANRHPEVVRLLLGARADLRARTHSWRQMMAVPPHGYPAYNREIPHGSYTALLFAVRAGDLESAKLLVAAGADVNDEDAWGVSATVLAAHAGFTDLAVFLLDKGADPNAGRAGFTALHCAIMRRDEPLVRALLARGADPGAPLKTWTPTRRSSRDWNFDPKLVGATPLWLAARFQQPEVMRLLAARGADGRFVHHSRYVAEKDYSEKSESLTTLMAALGAGGGAAWTPPSGNRDASTLETVRAALDLGADIHARTTGGRTALDLARESGQPAEVIALLMAACRSSGPGLCPPDRADASSPPR